MGIIRRDYYKKGSWNAIDDLSGQKCKIGDMRMQWNNLLVEKSWWSPKQPQQEIRPRLDRPARNPVRNIEPQITALTNAQLSTIVLSSTGVEYDVSSLVLSSTGVGYVVEADVLDSYGNPITIFTYDWAQIAADYPNSFFLPPPITTAQMI